jgi:hypothetical protein
MDASSTAASGSSGLKRSARLQQKADVKMVAAAAAGVSKDPRRAVTDRLRRDSSAARTAAARTSASGRLRKQSLKLVESLQGLRDDDDDAAFDDDDDNDRLLNDVVNETSNDARQTTQEDWYGRDSDNDGSDDCDGSGDEDGDSSDGDGDGDSDGDSDGDVSDEDGDPAAITGTAATAAAVGAPAAGAKKVQALWRAQAKAPKKQWDAPLPVDNAVLPDGPDAGCQRRTFKLKGTVTKLTRSLSLSYFRLFFDDEMLERMRSCTSAELRRRRRLRLAALRQKRREKKLSAASLKRLVKACKRLYARLRLSELHTFLAITLVMSVHSLPTLSLYWQVMGTPTASPCGGSRFRKWMPRDRFVTIKACMRFSRAADAPSVPTESPKFDRMWKIRAFLDSLNANLKVWTYLPASCCACL